MPRSISRRRRFSRGFTLVELLLVIAIIILLIGFLLPALNRAREQSVLIKCESNLRVWGQTAYLFSVDHRGRFPEAWGSRGTPGGPIFYSAVPNTLTGDDLPDPVDNGGQITGSWIEGGTSWDTFKQYGLTWAVANCPATDASTSTSETTPISGATNWVGVETPISNSAIWGTTLYHLNYLYVGGLAAYLKTSGATLLSTYNFGSRIPAGKTSDDDLSDEFLACDSVTDYVYWSQGYMVNHPLAGVPGRAKYLNILYGDGHVARDPTPTSVAASPTNYNLAWQSTSGPFFYWGQ